MNKWNVECRVLYLPCILQIIIQLKQVLIEFLEKADEIKEVMKGIKLNSVPDWASSISDEKWKDILRSTSRP